MPVIPILRAGLSGAGVSAAFPAVRNSRLSLAPRQSSAAAAGEAGMQQLPEAQHTQNGILSIHRHREREGGSDSSGIDDKKPEVRDNLKVQVVQMQVPLKLLLLRSARLAKLVFYSRLQWKQRKG